MFVDLPENVIFLTNHTTLSRLGSKKEWKDAFLKFKLSKHQLKTQ
jgi:hypothetical protein